MPIYAEEEEQKSSPISRIDDLTDELIPLTALSYLSSLAPSDPQLQVMVEQEDLLAALYALSPSLSREELAHYLRLKQQFSQSGRQHAAHAKHLHEEDRNGVAKHNRIDDEHKESPY